MKTITIILTAFAFFAISCNRPTRNQAETANSENVTEQNCEVNEIIIERRYSTEKCSIGKNQLFEIWQIDSVKYSSLREKVNPQRIKLEKITDLAQAKQMLEGVVVWDEVKDAGYHSLFLIKITFRNGKTHFAEDDYTSFVAFFPQEDILVLEGGHTSDVIFNLTTGEGREIVGNPGFTVYSPSKRFRLNGFHDGQQSVYFIQEKSGAQWNTIIEFTWGSEFEKLIGFIPEFISDAFWQDDTVLNFVIPPHYFPDRSVEKSFFQLILK